MFTLNPDFRLAGRLSPLVLLIVFAGACLFAQLAVAQSSDLVPIEHNTNVVPEQLNSVVETTHALPVDLSPWGMFMGADKVVKAVIISLVLASMLTWTIWLVKVLQLRVLRRGLQKGHRALKAASLLGETHHQVALDTPFARQLLQAAERERDAFNNVLYQAGIKERLASELDSIESETARRLTVGTGVLATIGSTAPFVGLFGTVWGVMNSFIGISKTQTTNLAVVAPGIAEALLATALGLVAAIPAVVIYNYFARSMSSTRALTSDMSAAIMRLVSLELDRSNVDQPQLKAVP